MSKFTSDNQPEGRGRPKGSVNKTTKILRDATPEILEALIDSAINGDTTAANLILRHSLPPVKAESRALALELKDDMTLTQKADLLVDAAMTGKCCPSMASQLLAAMNNVTKIREIDEILERLEELEKNEQSN